MSDLAGVIAFSEPAYSAAFVLGALASALGARMLIIFASSVCVLWSAEAVGLLPALPEWTLYALTACLLLGGFEAPVVIFGGKSASPIFWANIFVALLAVVLIWPIRSLLRAVTRVLPGWSTNDTEGSS
jgi:hypothetical protein